MSIKKMSLIAMMTCIMVVCSWLTIPAAVPFTMQTFALFCALLLLGGKSGLVVIALYIFMGCVGLPVFSGFKGGIGHVFGPTGGYIIGFIITAVLYLLFEPIFRKYGKLRVPALIIGLIMCYIAGTMWFSVASGIQGARHSTKAIISLYVLPYIIPDLAKLVLAWLVSSRMRRVISD